MKRLLLGGMLAAGIMAAGFLATGCAPKSNASLTIDNVESAPAPANVAEFSPAPPVDSSSAPVPISLEPIPAPESAALSTAGWAVDDAAQAKPLGVGDQVPNVRLASSEGAPVDLLDLVRSQKSVIIFYRGGWCPYCNTHLSELQSAEQELQRLGFRVVAISPDRPAKIRETNDSLALSYLLLSDSKAEAVRAFGLAFTVDEGTIKKYLEYGINLDEASGEPHHQLPVPAVFIADTSGTIQYRYYNPDYRTRLSKDELLAQARELK